MKIKNEKKALQMFCETNALRETYNSPFFNEADGGRLMATEGHLLILVDRKLLRGKYKQFSQRLPAFDFNRCDTNITVPFSAIEAAYNKFDLEPEKVTTDGQSIECPECDGSGEVEYEYTDNDGHTYYKDCDCPICMGTGQRNDYELVETGRKILPKESTFTLAGSYVKAEYLWRIVTALRLMGFESMVLQSQQRGSNIFRVCDGITVLLMSVMNQAEHHQYIELKQ